MGKRKNGKTRWFVEPKNAETSAVIMTNLLNTCGATEDNIYYGKKDIEGETHCVIEVDHRFISQMERDKKELRTKFNVFVQRDGAYAMKRWLFQDKKVMERPKPVRQKKVTQIVSAIFPAGK